MKGWKWLFKTK